MTNLIRVYRDDNVYIGLWWRVGCRIKAEDRIGYHRDFGDEESAERWLKHRAAYLLARSAA